MTRGRRLGRSLLLGFMCLLAAGCDISSGVNPVTAQAITRTSVAIDDIAASTRAAITTQTAYARQAASPSPPWGRATPAAAQIAAGASPTAAQVWIEVRVDTNCRTGPGRNYEMVGALYVGQRALVVQRSSVPDYWIIENPDRPGRTCYLWGRFATLEGDIGSLALDVPPTATPQPASISGWVYRDRNGNAERDEDEGGVQPGGVRLVLRVGACPGVAMLRVIEPNVYGRIMIEPLTAGTYCLSVDPEGTELDPAAQEIELPPNTQVDEVNFRLLP